MEIHSPFSDDDYFLIDHLPLVGQTCVHANKMPFKSHACPEYATPFFSVSRRFEEDLSSLLNLNSTYLPELAEDERNQKSSSDYDDDCADQHYVIESIQSGNSSNRNSNCSSNQNNNNNNNNNSNNNSNNNNNNNNNNSNNNNNNNYDSNNSNNSNNNNNNSNNNNNNSNIAVLSTNETPYSESYSIPSEYMSIARSQSHSLPSPVTCRHSSYGGDSDPADYSLLDDGYDGDILCFLGYQTSRWNSEDPETGSGTGSGSMSVSGCEHTDTERD
jgi:hypothetical protein